MEGDKKGRREEGGREGEEGMILPSTYPEELLCTTLIEL